MLRLLICLVLAGGTAATGLNFYHLAGDRITVPVLVCAALAAVLCIVPFLPRRRPAADPLQPAVMPCLLFLRGLLRIAPTAVHDALTEGYETADGAAAHDAAEHSAIQAVAPWHPDLVEEFQQLGRLSGAAANAALVVLAADQLTPAEQRLLAGAWRGADLPLLAPVPPGTGATDDAVAAVPWAPTSAALSAYALNEIDRLLHTVGAHQPDWPTLNAQHTQRLAAAPDARLRAWTTAQRSGRAAAVGYKTWAAWLPQFAADAALAILVCDLLGYVHPSTVPQDPAYPVLVSTWHDLLRARNAENGRTEAATNGRP